MLITSQATELHKADKPLCVAIGIFDGVHLGHQALLQTTRGEARRQHGLAAVITFDRHPNAIVAPDRNPPLIQPLSQRLRLFETLGVDATLVIPFDSAFSRLPAEAFIRGLVRDSGGLACLCVGEGFTFGHRRGGNIPLLQRLASELRFVVHALPPVCVDGTPVRSTRIREALRAGELEAASRLLGRPYSFSGVIVHGDEIGRSLGFPTANLNVTGLVLPPPGVYATWAHTTHGPHAAVLNLGFRPTLALLQPTLQCEVHLLDFHGDLYGTELEVTLLERLRPEQRFASPEALRDQIRHDVDHARRVFSRQTQPRSPSVDTSPRR